MKSNSVFAESLVFALVGVLQALEAALLAGLDVGMAGQDVADHRRAGFRAGGPQRLVVLGRERQAWVGHLPDHRALQAHGMAALHLLDAGLDVVDGHERRAVQPLGIGRAEVVHPVVVELEGFLLRLDVVDAEQRHPVIREQDLGGDAVGVLIAQAQMRIGRTGRR